MHDTYVLDNFIYKTINSLEISIFYRRTGRKPSGERSVQTTTFTVYEGTTESSEKDMEPNSANQDASMAEEGLCIIRQRLGL